MRHQEYPMWILVVEDSPTQAERLKSLLERRGYQVAVAENGAQALALLAERKPSLVISDIVMPEMDGYQLCRRIRADARLADLPVVLLTGLSDTKDVLDGLACEADSFITKPYDEDYLLEQVARMHAFIRSTNGGGSGDGVEIVRGGKKHVITAGRERMLTLLVSTYEAAVRRNAELSRSQDELQSLNDRLEDLVAEKTASLSVEIAVRKQTEAAMAKTNVELHEALDKIKVLNTLLPICAKCKKIRDEKGEWTEIETYIRARTDTEFTHGICPVCSKETFGDYARG